MFGEAQVLSHGHALIALLSAMVAMTATAVSFGIAGIDAGCGRDLAGRRRLLCGFEKEGVGAARGNRL